VLTLALPVAATAQNAAPISGFVIDARGSLINFGQDAELAARRGLDPTQLPPWGWTGVELGAHVYPLRLGPVTFGVGGAMHLGRATRHPGEDDPDPDAPAVKTRFVAYSPQLSFNFGHRMGWSYLSGGVGTSRMTVYADEGSRPDQPRAKTLNYGGGARWFVSPRLAFALDLRVFAINAVPQTGEQIGSPRMTRYAFSVGASFR